MWLSTPHSNTLMINNCYSYVNSTNPNELEIKDTKDSETSVSNFDNILEKDVNGNVTTKLNDKRDDFNFFIVPYLCNYKPSSPTYRVYVS